MARVTARQHAPREDLYTPALKSVHAFIAPVGMSAVLAVPLTMAEAVAAGAPELLAAVVTDPHTSPSVWAASICIPIRRIVQSVIARLRSLGRNGALAERGYHGPPSVGL